MDDEDQGGERRTPVPPDGEQHAEPRARWRRRQESPPAPAGEAARDEPEDERQDEAARELLAAEQARADDAVARLQRAQADFANYKRRSEQEREQQARFATQLLVQEMLPVLDNLDRVLVTMPESVRHLSWTEGLLLVDRHLRGTLEKQGLKPIEAVGTRFDPMQHEAIIHEDSAEHADDEVLAELRRGYTLHDKVVRPTLVKVAKHTGGIRPAK